VNCAPARRQRGSALVMGALGLAIALSCLMVLDVAHVFTVKRDLQKVADLAALAGASVPGDCAVMQARAEASAGANAHARGGNRTLRIDCGAWTPEAGFASAAAGASASALRATATRSVPYFFMLGAGREVEAQAIARNHAYDVFSLGTGLATLHAGALNTLLGALLRSNVNLDLLTYQGLAGSQLRLLDLVSADTLEVGSVQELLDADLRLGDLTLATAQALRGSNPLSASVLESIAVGIPSNLRLKLGTLLDVQVPGTEAAGQARLNALELLLAAAQVANGDNLLDLGASLPANPLASVDLKLRIVEPPRIAIGIEGTQAHSAQVRLLLDTRIANISLPGGIVSTSGLRLPLYVEAAQGTATLRRMECEPRREDCAVELDVQGGLARGCVGTDAMAAAATASGCGAAAQLLAADIRVLGVTIAKVDVKAHAVADLAPAGSQPVRFGPGGFAGSTVTDSHWSGSSSVSGSVSGLLGSLLGGLVLQPQVTVLGLDLGGVLGGLVNLLLATVGTAVGQLTTAVISPVLSSVVDPLLATLGVRVGLTDLHQIELHCGQAELVH
jgi:uncharacterized membrane protein